MELASKIISTLNKPFPEDESFIHHLKTISFVSLFAFVFLFIFQPFGIADAPESKFWISFGFGLVTFIAMLIYALLFNLIVHLKPRLGRWTYWKWIVYNLGIMVFISLANFLFARLWFFGDIIWSLYPTMMYSTLMIGIIPITAVGAIALHRQEKKYQKISIDINQNKIEQPQIGAVGNYIFEIPIEQIRFVEALQNYVNVAFVDTNGKFSKKTERSTLKKIIEELGDSQIVKCHRSYLVNKNEIISTSGNAQGLLLKLNNCQEEIPVSRSFVPKFRL